MPKASESSITADIIHQLFTYDPISGIFIRISDGTQFLYGPLKVGTEYHEVARYIWLHYYGEWPPLNRLIDHKDRDRSNTKIDNMRLATFSQNGFNFMSNAPWGYKGITVDVNRQKRWRAQIRINGRKVNLGRFYTIEEAAEAYRQAALKHHGEFACVE